MRHQINKLSKRHSTKAERRFSEALKELHIPFKTKVKIGGREIDFIIGKYAIEIDSHPQDVSKNYMIIENGYTPIHINNWVLADYLQDYLKEWLKKIWQEQDYSRHQEQQS